MFINIQNYEASRYDICRPCPYFFIEELFMEIALNIDIVPVPKHIGMKRIENFFSSGVFILT